MATELRQIEMTVVDENGNEMLLYPVNRAKDIKVGKLIGGSDELPGETDDEVLVDTLKNLKASIANLRTLRGEIATGVASRAPIDHASATTTYGLGNTEKYGHVRLTDNYGNDRSPNADTGVAISPSGVHNLWRTIQERYAEKAHSWSVDEHEITGKNCGVAGDNVYGHVRITDNIHSDTGYARYGIAASAYAVYNLNLSKLDNAHSSKKSTETNIGHVSIENHNYVTEPDTIPTTFTAGKTLSSYAIGRIVTSLQTMISNVESNLTHGTSTIYGLVKLSDDYYSTPSDTANSSIASSKYAVQRVYETSARAIHVFQSPFQTEYAGMATMTYFGHVITSDVYDSIESLVFSNSSGDFFDAVDAIVPTQKALYNGLQTKLNLEHGDTVGNSNTYGHVKLMDWTTDTRYDENSGVAAAASAIYRLDMTKAPSNHASDGGYHGVGSGTLYGHVKLSDVINSQIGTGGATKGVAASSYAVNSLRLHVNNNYAPISHSSTSNQFGVGSSTHYGHVKLSHLWAVDVENDQYGYNTAPTVYSVNMRINQHFDPDGEFNKYGTSKWYGHVKLTDNIDVTQGDADSGIAASAHTVYVLNMQKAPTYHSSPYHFMYGAATSTLYGHVKTINTNYVTEDPPTANVPSEVLSAYAVGRIVTSLKALIENAGSGSIVVKHLGYDTIPSSYDSSANVAASAYSVSLQLNNKAPYVHTAAQTYFGGATSSLYGHVKLTDSYSTNGGAASSSIAASGAAVYNCYVNRAPKLHTSSTASTYGAASTSVYGHVKTTSSYTSYNSASSVVPTAGALYNAYQNLLTKINKVTPVKIYDGWVGCGLDPSLAVSFDPSLYVTQIEGQTDVGIMHTYYPNYSPSSHWYAYAFPGRIRFRIEGQIMDSRWRGSVNTYNLLASIPFSEEVVIYTGEAFNTSSYHKVTPSLYLPMDKYLHYGFKRDVYIVMWYSISSKMLYLLTSTASGIQISSIYVYPE